MRKFLMLEDKNGEPVEIPAKIALCDNCEGSGSAENPAFSNGFTSSEWNDMDPDDRESYMRGAYDVKCDCCNGSGRVLVPDAGRLSFYHLRALAIQRQNIAAKQAVRAEQEAERRAFGYC